MGGRVKKGSSKTIDIVSYASKVSVNVSYVRLLSILDHQTHFKFVNWLNSYNPCVHQNMCDWQ